MSGNSNRYLPGRPPYDLSPFNLSVYLQKLQFAVSTEQRVKTPIQTANFNTGTERLYPCDATSGNITVTLPPAIQAADKVYVIKKIDASANTVIVTPNGTDTIDGAATSTLTTQWNVLVIRSDGVSQWYVEHSLIGAGTSQYNGAVLLTAGSGTVNVPTGATLLRARITGGGAAGGGTSAAVGKAGGGGGSGETIEILIQVTSGGTFSYTVGAKGTGVSGANGNDGTASSVTGTNGVAYTAAGGIHGVLGGASNGSGGNGGGRLGGTGGANGAPGVAGGVAVTEGIFGESGAGGGGPGTNGGNNNGGAGGASDTFAGGTAGTGSAAPAPGGGGGGSSPYGVGGTGASAGTPANGGSAAATAYGAGGGGAATGAVGTARAGGDGAPGAIFYWFI